MIRKSVFLAIICFSFLGVFWAAFEKAEALEKKDSDTIELLNKVAAIKPHFPGMEFIPCDLSSIHFNEEVCAMQYQVALEIVEKNYQQKTKSAALKTKKSRPAVEATDVQELERKMSELENKLAESETKATNLWNVLQLLAALAVVTGIVLVLALVFIWTDRRQEKNKS